jgi:hypothetical protein
MTTDPLTDLHAAWIAVGSVLLAIGATAALVAPRRVRRWLAEPRTYQPHTEWLASQKGER